MAKIVVCMPYYDRQYQLNKTLATMAESKHNDFSVVIVDDNSPQDIVLPTLPFPIDVIKLRSKSWTNCSPVHNMAFNRALEYKPDAIVIQSPECYYVGDVLMHIDEHLNEDNYLAFGCFQVDKPTTFKDHDITSLSSTKEIVTHNNGGKGQTAWWNHSKYNPKPQYWCAAITARNLIKVNGIDERFAHGYAIEDGWFIDQVERAGMKIEIVDYPFVVHQWHERIYPKDTMALVKRNEKLWEDLKKTNEFRSVHRITPDLKWSGN